MAARPYEVMRFVSRAVFLILFLAGCIGAAYLGLIVRDRRSPIADPRIRILNAGPILRGSEVQVDLTISYRRQCDARVKRRLIDGNGVPYNMQTIELDNTAVGMVHFVSYVTIPLSFPPGPAFYESEPAYMCNWFQHLWPVREATRHVPFVVEDGTLAAPAVSTAPVPAPDQPVDQIPAYTGHITGPNGRCICDAERTVADAPK